MPIRSSFWMQMQGKRRSTKAQPWALPKVGCKSSRKSSEDQTLKALRSNDSEELEAQDVSCRSSKSAE